MIRYLRDNTAGNIASTQMVVCDTVFFDLGSSMGSLARQINQRSAIPDIRFEPNNTLCFDNEALRYLISFTDDEHKTNVQSWSCSVDETQRFANFIFNELKLYSQ